MIDFAVLKRSGRQVLHSTLAVAAVYTDPNWPQGVPVTVRWHSKLATSGLGLEDSGVNIITGIQRLVFNADELADTTGMLAAQNLVRAPIILQHAGTVDIPEYSVPTGGAAAHFTLDSEMPADGPLNIYWTVA